MNYIIPTGKIKHHVIIEGDLMTGNTYPVKDIIKKFFGGKWLPEKKAWQINHKDLNRWVGTKIYPAPEDTEYNPSSRTYNPKNWCNPDGTLNEDF